ncbi:hypothetical protein BOTBODRAFT_141061 [Botryobasidium botryosum FD-172 SS1]|uniref:Tail specific protease domain-containing protein n=1 Tax=Botryobasidium botryosum (strain FD-172 SS1) TaxID=930990 RepID=A0A067LVY4_BOTB1|nr:hypothetical protein BOTBODRAFT_141061 [Botryobasidium botryosum FD-172 SS1]
MFLARHSIFTPPLSIRCGSPPRLTRFMSTSRQNLRAFVVPPTNLFEMHQDILRTVRRLQDGHAFYENSCYDSLFITYHPFPVVSLGSDIHIAPEAYNVTVSAFGANAIKEWEEMARIEFAKYSGAKIINIDGKDPWQVVDENAAVTGTYQAHAPRQNLFFSRYTAGSWDYVMGDFASQGLPLVDSVTLLVLPTGASKPEQIKVPFRSLFNIDGGSVPFEDRHSLWEKNCAVQNNTNGYNYYDTQGDQKGDGHGTHMLIAAPSKQESRPARRPWKSLAQKGHDGRRVAVSMFQKSPLLDATLPPALIPAQHLGRGGNNTVQFFMLDDGQTGVLALGDFIGGGDQEPLYRGLLGGLQDLRKKGAKRLLVDVSSNGGGYICGAAWLHRILAGPGPETVPQAGFDTKVRVNALNKAVVDAIIHKGIDPKALLDWNPATTSLGNSTGYFSNTTNWLEPSVPTLVNGVQDDFSQKIGAFCPEPWPYGLEPPAEPIFNPDSIVILGNSDCASSCTLFSIDMVVKHGVKSVVYGGKPGVQQQYASMVGGAISTFSVLDSAFKTAGLKDHPLAPPDLLVNAHQGIVFEMAFSIKKAPEMEEYQNHPADIQIPLTLENVNKPVAIWEDVIKQTFGSKSG